MRQSRTSKTRSTRQRRLGPLLASLLLAATTVLAGTAASADGTETLGPPTITPAEGSGIAVGGTGMVVQPSTIDVEVPTGASVEQVLLYWEGQSTAATGDDDIVIEDDAVQGTLIGGPTFFFGIGDNAHWSAAYRADITGLGLVSAGSNSLEVSGLEFDQVNDGVGILVVYDDGTESELALFDGLDLAFFDFKAPRDTTVPQVFTFTAESVERTADLSMFFSSVAGQDFAGERPTAISVSIDDGTPTYYSNLLASNDGEEWDTLVLEITIPAGATTVTVQALSADVDGTGNFPASFTWTVAALSVPLTPPPPPPPGGGEGCTPGYWKQPHHLDSWVGYDPDQSYEAVFGVDAEFDKSLLGALQQGGGGEKALGRHAVAALLNSASADVDYEFTSAQVIALVQDAYATGDFNGIKDQLEAENEEGCPLD